MCNIYNILHWLCCTYASMHHCQSVKHSRRVRSIAPMPIHYPSYIPIRLLYGSSTYCTLQHYINFIFDNINIREVITSSSSDGNTAICILHYIYIPKMNLPFTNRYTSGYSSANKPRIYVPNPDPSLSIHNI